MTKEFKVGDKVTSITHGKGKVINTISSSMYPIKVEFERFYYVIGFTQNGNQFENAENISLFHGHGTFKTEFIEDKELKYEWQWLYKNKGLYETTAFYKTYEEMFKCIGQYHEVIERLEKSKKEIKS